MGANRFLNQRSGDFGFGLVLAEPGIAERFELGGIFMTKDQFCGAATMGDGISAGALLSVRSGRAGAAGAWLFRWNFGGTRHRVNEVVHGSDAATSFSEQVACERHPSKRRRLIWGEIGYFTEP